MKILLITQYFWPESFGAGVWLRELAEWLTEDGHEVTVLTGFPNHPEGRIFQAYRGRVYQRESYRGIKIIRTWLYTTPRTGGLVSRILSQTSFAASSILGGMVVGKQDLVMYFPPPLPVAFSAWAISRLRSAFLVLSVQDIEPDRSINLGLFTNPRLIRILKWMERFCYERATRICVLSEGMRNTMLAKGVPAEKIRLTPNWANGELIRPLPPSSSLRSELGLNCEFVVLYSGNMGYTMRDLDTVVDAARLLESESDIKFVLAGDGVRRAAVETRAHGLRNVSFLPIQSLERFPNLLATGDLGLVLLSPEGTQASVPSKIYSIMAAGRAVLAICDPECDTARLVRQAGCGVSVLPGSPEELAKLIRVYRDKRDRSCAEGKRARQYFEQHCTPEVCIPRYTAVIHELCPGSGRS
jgi:glycosyltransferase involved in cell wall biosynthesis